MSSCKSRIGKEKVLHDKQQIRSDLQLIQQFEKRKEKNHDWNWGYKVSPEISAL